jgi:hypothetical protein
MNNEHMNEPEPEEQNENRELAPGVILYKKYTKITDQADVVGKFIWKVRTINKL